MDFWKTIVRDYSELVKSLIPCLWKDRGGEPILVTKKIEISLQSEHELLLYADKGATYKKLKKEGLILREKDSDEPYEILYSDMKNLPRILQLGGLYKRRPNISGERAKEREKKYGHAYIPYRPNVDKSPVQQLGLLETAAGEARQDIQATVCTTA
jgi:hypothetical protein